MNKALELLIVVCICGILLHIGTGNADGRFFYYVLGSAFGGLRIITFVFTYLYRKIRA